MTEKRFKHSEIQAIIDEAQGCRDIAALCAEHGITVDKLHEWQQKQSQDSPQERSRVITPGGYKPKTKTDFYNENLHHFQHVSVDYG